MFVWLVDKSLVTWLKRCTCFTHGPMFVCFSFFGRYSMNVIMGCLFSVNMDPEPLIKYASKMLRISPLMFTIQGRNLIIIIFFCMKTAVCLPSHLLARFIFPACFPVVKPVYKMLGLSIFLQESTRYLGEIVKMIVADHKRSPEVRSEHE